MEMYLKKLLVSIIHLLLKQNHENIFAANEKKKKKRFVREISRKETSINKEGRDTDGEVGNKKQKVESRGVVKSKGRRPAGREEMREEDSEEIFCKEKV